MTMVIYECIIDQPSHNNKNNNNTTNMADTVMLNFNSNRFNNGTTNVDTPNRCNGDCHQSKFNGFESQGSHSYFKIFAGFLNLKFQF